METTQPKNTINLLGIRKKAILALSGSIKYPDLISMREISKAQEIKLDNLSDKSPIYLYGEVDLQDEDDLRRIKDYNLINNDGRGMVYNNFNYETGTYALVPAFNGREMEDTIKWGPCIDPVLWFKFNHCLIGKPKRILICNDQWYESWYGRRK